MNPDRRIMHLLIWSCWLFLTPFLPAADPILEWDPNTEADLAGYKLYYGTLSRVYGTPIDVGNRTTYTVTGLGPGTYYFAVTAYNTSGYESGYSNEVSTTISGSCTYSLYPSSRSFTASSGTDSVAVTTSAGCSWSAASNAAWISITSGSSGSGNGSVGYSVSANTSSSSRTGTMTIAGQSFTVTQQGQTTGSGCDVNKDSNVNVLDLQILANVILGISSCSGSCDINKDSVVNVLDLQVLSNVILGIGTCP